VRVDPVVDVLQKRPVLGPVFPVHVVRRFSLGVGLDVRRARQAALQCRVREVGLGEGFAARGAVGLQGLQPGEHQRPPHVVPLGGPFQLVQQRQRSLVNLRMANL
jgi:hypothetical protein